MDKETVMVDNSKDWKILGIPIRRTYAKNLRTASYFFQTPVFEYWATFEDVLIIASDYYEAHTKAEKIKEDLIEHHKHTAKIRCINVKKAIVITSVNTKEL